MIHLIRERATSLQVKEMLEEYEGMIKIVVDIRRHILSGGGEMHADVKLFCLRMAANRMIYGALTGFPASKGSRLNRLSISVPAWEIEILLSKVKNYAI